MRRFVALALVFVLFSFSACRQQVTFSAPSYTVETETEHFTDGTCGVMLKYPVISGYTDVQAQNALNEKIAAFAHAMYEREVPVSDDGDGYSYTVTGVRITFASDAFLSAVIGGTVTSGFSGNESCFSYTINCSLKDGTFYSSEEILADYSVFVDRFVYGAFSQDFGHAGLTAEIELEDLISQYKAEYGIFPEVYFTENGIGFVIEVIPLFDGYAGFTLPYAQAKKFLNQENPFVEYVTK